VKNKVAAFIIFLVFSIAIMLVVRPIDNQELNCSPLLPQQPPPPQSQPQTPPQQPAECLILQNFEAYPQQGGTTCGPVAVRNVLKHMTDTLYAEARLAKEVIEADHRGLEFLREDLRKIGINSPETLSRYGTTPVGNTAVLNEYLPPNMKAEFREIPSLDDRIALIVDSINKGRPVMVPFTRHWTVAIGYNLKKQELILVNAGIGNAQSRPEGGSYNTVSFQDFDYHNSFTNLPSGRMGKVFQLANEKGLGRWVLIYITDK
jgi:hypothetical protein